MVDRERHPQNLPDLHLAIDDDWLLTGGADSEDRRLGRVDNCREVFGSEHAEVGDRERAAFQFGLLQGAGVGARPNDLIST